MARGCGMTRECRDEGMQGRRGDIAMIGQCGDNAGTDDARMRGRKDIGAQGGGVINIIYIHNRL